MEQELAEQVQPATPAVPVAVWAKSTADKTNALTTPSKTTEGNTAHNTIEDCADCVIEDTKTIEEDTKTIEKGTKTIEGDPTNKNIVDTKTIEEDTKTIEKGTKTIEEDTKTIEEDTKTIEEDTKTIEEDTKTIEEDTKTIEEDTKTIEEDTKTIEEETKTFEGDTKTIEEDTKTIEEDTKTIEEDPTKDAKIIAALKEADAEALANTQRQQRKQLASELWEIQLFAIILTRALDFFQADMRRESQEKRQRKKIFEEFHTKHKVIQTQGNIQIYSYVAFYPPSPQTNPSTTVLEWQGLVPEAPGAWHKYLMNAIDKGKYTV
jgi:DNA repair exonuclease SbcCD ATPase subunit